MIMSQSPEGTHYSVLNLPSQATKTTKIALGVIRSFWELLKNLKSRCFGKRNRIKIYIKYRCTVVAPSSCIVP